MMLSGANLDGGYPVESHVETRIGNEPGDVEEDKVKTKTHNAEIKSLVVTLTQLHQSLTPGTMTC